MRRLQAARAGRPPAPPGEQVLGLGDSGVVLQRCRRIRRLGAARLADHLDHPHLGHMLPLGPACRREPARHVQTEGAGQTVFHRTATVGAMPAVHYGGEEEGQQSAEFVLRRALRLTGVDFRRSNDQKWPRVSSANAAYAHHWSE